MLRQVKRLQSNFIISEWGFDLAHFFFLNMTLDKIASAIYNDVKGGIAGMSANENLSLEQLQDEVIEERQAVMKEWFLKNLLNKKDYLFALNCVNVDCKDMSGCKDVCCNADVIGKKVQHFEIPQLMNDLGDDAIEFIGSTDRMVKYTVYTDPSSLSFQKYKKRPSNKPYVYVEKTPNSNNMYDCWLFNAPFAKKVTVIGIFKDLRQLEDFCIGDVEFLDFGPISSEVKRRLTEKKIKYYRQLYPQPHANDLIPR